MPRRFDHALLSVAEAAYGRFMAVAPSRETYGQHRVRLVDNVRLSPHVQRLTFAGSSLQHYRPLGPDEYVGLVFAEPGAPLVLPDAEALNVARAVSKLPAENRPTVRYYTIRRHRPESGEVDIDIVTHGDAGPGSRFALTAEPGVEVGLKEGSAGYRPPEPRGRQLLVADETAVPALAAIAESLTTEQAAQVTAFVEIPSDDYIAEIPETIDVTWFHRGEEAPGSLLVPFVTNLEDAEFTSAWLCAEGGAIPRIRKHLVSTTSLDKRAVFFKGYWKNGRVGA